MLSQGTRRKSMTKIWIDAGHGGKDPGASGNGLVEKNWVLATAKQLQTELVKAGFEVGMTRTNDTFLELRERAKKANSFKANLFQFILMRVEVEVTKISFIHPFQLKQQRCKKYCIKISWLKLPNMEWLTEG